VINDKSQGSIAKHLRLDGLLHYTFITQFTDERILKYCKHLVKLQAECLIMSYTPFTLYFCPQRCRSHYISKILVYYGQKLLLIVVMLTGRWLSLLSAKYQTAVNQFWLTDRQTDTVTDWPTADHVRHFAATSFSLLQQLCTVSHGIFLCEHLFVSEFCQTDILKQFLCG